MVKVALTLLALAGPALAGVVQRDVQGGRDSDSPDTYIQ